VSDAVQRYDCPGCGAEVAFPATVLSQLCAFCETPLVKSADTDAEPIDAVAPFELDAKQAAGRLAQHLSGRWLAPEAVRKAGRPEELKAVLVPFWVHDATAHSQWRAEVGITWYSTETYTVTVNGKTQTRTRQKKHTDWHTTSGTHAAAYQDHLVSGSRGLPEAEANELEPFDLGRALPYAPERVAGLVAELPSVDHAEARRVAADELERVERRAISKFLPGDSSRGLNTTSSVEVQAVRLVLLPVWIATWKWKGEVIRLNVNGQTGEVVGSVPRSTLKIVAIVALVLGLLAMALICAGGFTAVAALLNQHAGGLR
jgi:hypothetical protein